MRRVRRVQHRATLGMIRSLNQIAALVGNNPATTVAPNGEMSNVHTRRPILWLDKERLADRRTSHFLVRMTVEKEIDTRHFARDALSDVFARYFGAQRIVARWLVEAGVHRDDDDVCTGISRLFNGFSNRGNDVAESQTPGDVLRVPHSDARGRRADDSNLYARALHHRPRVVSVNSNWIQTVSIRGQEWKLRLANCGVEIGNPVVVLVVANRRRVVLHRVHRCDDRILTVTRNASRHIREWISLQQISGVQ